MVAFYPTLMFGTRIHAYLKQNPNYVTNDFAKMTVFEDFHSEPMIIQMRAFIDKRAAALPEQELNELIDVFKRGVAKEGIVYKSFYYGSIEFYIHVIKQAYSLLKNLPRTCFNNNLVTTFDLTIDFHSTSSSILSSTITSSTHHSKSTSTSRVKSKNTKRTTHQTTTSPERGLNKSNDETNKLKSNMLNTLPNLILIIIPGQKGIRQNPPVVESLSHISVITK